MLKFFFTRCYPSGVLFGFACVYGLHIKYPCCTTCIFLCFFCPTRVCPGFFPLFFFFPNSKTEPEICFKVLGLLQWSSAKFVLILFCKGWWHKRRRRRDRKKRKDGFQDEMARHLLMCHQIWVLRDLDRDPTSGRAVCYFVPCFLSDFFYFPLLLQFPSEMKLSVSG